MSVLGPTIASSCLFPPNSPWSLQKQLGQLGSSLERNEAWAERNRVKNSQWSLKNSSLSETKEAMFNYSARILPELGADVCFVGKVSFEPFWMRQPGENLHPNPTRGTASHQRLLCRTGLTGAWGSSLSWGSREMFGCSASWLRPQRPLCTLPRWLLKTSSLMSSVLQRSFSEVTTQSN